MLTIVVYLDESTFCTVGIHGENTCNVGVIAKVVTTTEHPAVNRIPAKGFLEIHFYSTLDGQASKANCKVVVHGFAAIVPYVPLGQGDTGSAEWSPRIGLTEGKFRFVQFIVGLLKVSNLIQVKARGGPAESFGIVPV